MSSFQGSIGSINVSGSNNTLTGIASSSQDQTFTQTGVHVGQISDRVTTQLSQLVQIPLPEAPN